MTPREVSTILPTALQFVYIRTMENKANDMTQKEATLNEQMSAVVYKQLFTDVEWDAIASAMGDYSDYGDEEASIADKIQTKIARIYELTAD